VNSGNVALRLYSTSSNPASISFQVGPVSRIVGSMSCKFNFIIYLLMSEDIFAILMKVKNNYNLRFYLSPIVSMTLKIPIMDLFRLHTSFYEGMGEGLCGQL
jgi:hypothetical protein